MHLVRIRIADAGRIALHAEKIMDGIPQYYVQQYRRIKKKQEADQELAAGFLLKKYLNVSRCTVCEAGAWKTRAEIRK